MYQQQNCLFDDGFWLDHLVKSQQESILYSPMLLTTSFFPLPESISNDPNHFYPIDNFEQNSGLSSPSSFSSSLDPLDTIQQQQQQEQQLQTTPSTLAIKPKKQLKNFDCHLFYRSFARKHDLQRHIRVHTGAKPYSCLSCTKTFARTDALKRHLRIEEKCKSSPIIQAMKESGNRRYQDL